jgi:acyl carrier protein
VPAEFVVLAALPRSASGKVLVQELVRAASEAAAALRSTAQATAPEDVFAIAARCFNCAVGALSAGSTPFNTDGWDSLAHMAFIEELEAAFGMQFSALEITEILSLGDAVRVVAAGALSDVAP